MLIRSTLPLLVTLAVLGCRSSYKVPGLVKDPPGPVTDHPSWSIPQIEMTHSAAPGTHYEWLLTYKDSPNKNEFPDSALFVVPTVQG